jgi:Dak1 domain-containing protein
VVAEARRTGAHVEGEIEGIQGVEDDLGSDDAPRVQSLELYLVHRHAHHRLAERGITVGRSYVGEYCTSLDMAGASLTLVRLDDEIDRLLAAPAEVAARIF